MKQRIALGVFGYLLATAAFATPPVTLSGPSPAIASAYGANTSTTITYTITNNTPQRLPITVSGISNGVQRTSVSEDCGDALLTGPSTCHIGVSINPSNEQGGSSINQTLRIDYQGRTPLTSPIAFSISAAFAYVTPELNATAIDQLLLGNDGSLSSSATAYTASGSEVYGQMAFATVNGVQYAYILNPSGAVYWCSINSDGSFSDCQATASLPSLGTWQARAIAFATFDAPYAYVLDPSNYVVYQCSLDASGNFSACPHIDLPTDAPYGIAFATDSNESQHAYIADAGMGGPGNFGKVWLCSMTNGGSLSSCTSTPSSGAPDWIPYSVAFAKTNSIQYAYVADNGTGAPGHVYRCSLNNDGSLVNSSCVPTPSNDSTLTNWYPYQIAFQTVNGTQYAYVVNSSGSSIGNIYRCPLDSNGLFTTNCVLTPVTPPSPWLPSGIAFR